MRADCWHEIRALTDHGIWCVRCAPSPIVLGHTGKCCCLLLLATLSLSLSNSRRRRLREVAHASRLPIMRSQAGGSRYFICIDLLADEQATRRGFEPLGRVPETRRHE